MYNQLFIPDFLFNFYSVRKSPGTPARSDMGTMRQKILQMTGQLRFFASLVAHVTKVFQLQ